MDEMRFGKNERQGKSPESEISMEKAKKLDFVKEVISFNPEIARNLRDKIDALSARNAGDEKFQKFVVGYLRDMLKFLSSPMITDTFGDTPEGHVERRNTIRNISQTDPDAANLLENQKISRNAQTGPLNIFRTNILGMVYPPHSQEDVAALENLSQEAEALIEDIEAKFNGLTTTPLEEKIAAVHRTEDFITRGMEKVMAMYDRGDGR